MTFVKNIGGFVYDLYVDDKYQWSYETKEIAFERGKKYELNGHSVSIVETWIN